MSFFIKMHEIHMYLPMGIYINDYVWEHVYACALEKNIYLFVLVLYRITKLNLKRLWNGSTASGRNWCKLSRDGWIAGTLLWKKSNSYTNPCTYCSEEQFKETESIYDVNINVIGQKC